MQVATQAGQPEKIRVFPLADPQDWVKNKEAILKTILAAINPGLPGFLKVKYNFSIHPVSGWIRYTLNNDLWSNTIKTALPQSAEMARVESEKFISRLQEYCLKKEYQKLKIPPILPSGNLITISHVSTTPVFHNKQPWVDHWLCRFNVKVRPFQNDSTIVPIYGSSIDIRIGQNNRVCSFVSQWRPAWSDRMVMADFISFHEPPSLSKDGPRATLLYELDGENAPQNFLTPFHFLFESDDEARVFSASNYSMVLKTFFVPVASDLSRVYAFIEGGGPNYIINWAYWRPDSVFDEGLVSLGERNTIDLGPGTYNLMLHVRDESTGLERLFESMVYIVENAMNNVNV